MEEHLCKDAAGDGRIGKFRPRSGPSCVAVRLAALQCVAAGAEVSIRGKKRKLKKNGSSIQTVSDTGGYYYLKRGVKGGMGTIETSCLLNWQLVSYSNVLFGQLYQIGLVLTNAYVFVCKCRWSNGCYRVHQCHCKSYRAPVVFLSVVLRLGEVLS